MACWPAGPCALAPVAANTAVRALHALSERADWLMRSIGDLDPTDEEQLELIRSARKAMQHLENMLARLEAT